MVLQGLDLEGAALVSWHVDILAWRKNVGERRQRFQSDDFYRYPFNAFKYITINLMNRIFRDEESRKDFRHIVKSANRQHWQRKSSEATTDVNMYRMAR